MEKVNKKEKNDGPLLLSANPYHEVVKKDNNRNKLPELPPQRIWDDDRAQNSQRNSNYHVTNSFPAFPQPTNHGVQFSSKIPTKQQNSEKPNTIREVSHQIISSGDCGEEVLEEKAVYHDDFQVYHSSAYKRKMKKIEELKNNVNNRGLKPAKTKVKTRFVLTKLDPESTREQVQLELLDFFEDFEEVYVRKVPMQRHSRYSTFVFIVTSENELNIRAIENADWPGEVRCFFAPNNQSNKN